MILSSPFMAAAPVLDAQSAHAIQMCNDLIPAEVHPAVILFGHPNDRFHHIWEAAATPATLRERMIDLGGNQELPRILVEQRNDGRFDLLLRDPVAVADKHGSVDLCTPTPRLTRSLESLAVGGSASEPLAPTGAAARKIRQRHPPSERVQGPTLRDMSCGHFST